MLTDPFGRPITYLRISLTDRCNLRCAYGMPAGGLRWLPKSELLSDAEVVQAAAEAAALGISKIRLTGGEPLIRPGVVELVARLAAIPGVEDLSLTTNAIRLERLARPLAEAGLTRVNVSLDTLQVERFRRITRFGDHEQAWQGILAAEQAGLAPVKLNAVVIRGFNDDELTDLARLTLAHPWQVRFIEVMPIGNTQEWGAGMPAPQGRYLSVQEMHARLVGLGLERLAEMPGSGPARLYRIPGGLGTVGFISPLGEHFCQSCNRLRLTADGKLRACLVKDGEISLRETLRGGRPLAGLFRQAVAAKPAHHNLLASQQAESGRGMSQIGG